MTGRPTEYTADIGRRICEAVSVSQDGLRKTLEANGLPPLGTIMQWRARIPDFTEAFAYARAQQLQAMAEDIVDISRDDSLDPNDKRIRIDTLKWLLSKLVPRTYGDKLDVTSAGEALAPPSHQIDARIQSIIMQAQRRRDDAVLSLPPEAQSLLD